MKVLLKLTLALFTATLVCSSVPAHAKISFGPKGKTLTDGQITQLKGFIYDAWSPTPKASMRQESGPDFAKTIIWLDHAHTDKKVYDISKIETPEAGIVREAIRFIIEFSKGKIHKDAPEHVVKAVLVRWSTIGERAKAVYEQNRKGKVKWDLYLDKSLPEKSKGKKTHE